MQKGLSTDNDGEMIDLWKKSIIKNGRDDNCMAKNH